MEANNGSNELQTNDLKSTQKSNDNQIQEINAKSETKDMIGSEIPTPNQSVDSDVTHLNGSSDQIQNESKSLENSSEDKKSETAEDISVEPTSKSEELTNGDLTQDLTQEEAKDVTPELVPAVVPQVVPEVKPEVPNMITPVVTRKKRNSTQLIGNTISVSVISKTTENQSQPNSEQRLTRSRYGRLQKAKTPNPEMITYDVKRRSSIKSNDSVPVTPKKTEDSSKRGNTLSNESTPKLRKSKRRTSGSPRESARKRQNKLDSVIHQIKSNSNESEQLSGTPGASKKKSIPKESMSQKKCIELTGDSTSRIVDRYLLTKIPPKEGEYSVGDLIWAKVSGYPFWPCMISVDPISGLYSKVSGVSHKSGNVYHVQYFGPKALRGWTSLGQVMPFEGRAKYLEKLEALKDNSPKTQSSKIASKFAIKPSLKKEWDQSVDEAEEASKMNRDDRVRGLTFEYVLSSKDNLRRKSENCIKGEIDLKRKKMNSSPEDIYDFDDDADAVNISQTTPGLMWRKRVQKGDFATYVERHYQVVEKENPGADRKELEEMLQRRWDLLGEDLRSLYTDRKFTQIDDNEVLVVTPKVSVTSNSKISHKSNAKRNSIKSKEQNDCNESDSEGNLVIAETPLKKSSKKNTKSANKTNSQPLIDSSEKILNSVKKPELKASQNKKSQKKSASKALKPKKLEENDVIEKPIAQNSEQSLVHFGIDYLDDFGSSEDNSSTSEPEAVDGVKTGFDKFCILCNESDSSDLLCCSGGCFQMFHRKCAKYEGTDNQFKCHECESGIHSCFICKNVEDGQQKETQKCADIKCGKFYHSSCLEKGFPVKYNDQKDSFVCPLHFCLNCHIESQNDKEFRPSRRRLVKCISCPTAYHLGDYCIAAGTLQVSQNYVICPDHRIQKKKDRHVNVNYCFSCLTGGQLICCESCPAAFHSSCLDYTLDPDSNFYCTDCTSRKPLHYGDVVWVKLGFYRWWPGQISHPKAVPDNIMKLPHGVGEFPVYFFGSHDFFWVHKGRVFQYMEDDNKTTITANSGGKKNSKSLMKTFKLATEEAAEKFKSWQETKVAVRRAMLINKPPPYIHIKSNKAVGPKVQMTNSDESQISLCECKVKNDLSCNDENCINRALMVECDPKLCRDECKNQRFIKRDYISTKPFKTDSAGWGLIALEDIKKGQFVIEYVGELIDEEECQRRLKSAAENNVSNFYFLTIDKDKIIDAGPKGNLARFMNHSCQPNCETQKWMVNGSTRVGLFAICDIPSATELTFNYNLDCRGNEKTRCVCRQTNCSGFLGVRPNKTDETHNKKTAANGQNNGRKKRKKQEKKASMVESEDHCFSCREGGDLIMCDRKGCPKSYHLECLKLEQIPKGKWECPRHFCDTCGKSATALCSYCPNSACRTHADPSKLTQLPDGGLMCSEHNEQDINGLLMQSEVDSTHEDIEAMREEPKETIVEPEPSNSSSILETSSESITTAKTQNECNKSEVDLWPKSL